MKAKYTLALLLICLASPLAAQKFEGLAATPPMGWNSWNTFQGNISESLIKEMADAIVSSGMQKASGVIPRCAGPNLPIDTLADSALVQPES